MELLQKISEINAVSGNEYRLINEIAPEMIQKYKPENMNYIDNMGNIILFKKGRKHTKTMAVITHTDETGYIVNAVTDKGFLKFEDTGCTDARVIISKKVSIGKEAVKGIIGMKAIHLQKKTERENVVAVKNLFIDIGAKNKAAALKRVSLGDYVSFDTEFARISDNVIKGKAFDRMGIYCVLEGMKTTPEFDTYFVFASQQHVGSRGAVVALEKIKPDFVLIVDAVENAESYGTLNYEQAAKLHQGTVIAYRDTKGIADSESVDKLIKLAENNNVKIQVMQSAYGKSSLGAVRSEYGGTKAVLAAIPCRYMNTPVSLMGTDDLENTAKLVKAFVKKASEIL